MVHRLGLGKVRHLAVGDLWVHITFVQGNFESPKCQGWRIRVMHKQSTLGHNHYCAIQKRVNWVPVDGGL